jgi:Family of unknown function (DUF6760)
VPALRVAVRSGAEWPGGVAGRPLDELFEEVAFIAYHFHWPHDEIMGLEHRERTTWVERISALNDRINRESAEADAWR